MELDYDPTRYTEAHDAKIRAVVNAFAADVSGMTREDAEDMAQDSRLSCWRWLLEHTGQELGPGLVRLLATQACRDFERATRKHREMDSIPDYYDAEGDQGTQEYSANLASICSKIVQDEREALVAYYLFYEQAQERDIVEVTDLPQSTVNRIIARLKQRAIDLGVIG